MNKDIIAILVGVIALLAGALAAFLIIRKKFAADDDFDEFEDFDMIGDDEFFDEDDFFDDDEYSMGNENTIPFAAGQNGSEESL